MEPHYRRLVEGFQRIFTSTIYFGSESTSARQQGWDCKRFHFFDRLRIWCTRTAEEDLVEPKPDHNIIRLSEPFWGEIQAHPIPGTSGSFASLPAIPDVLTSICGFAGDASMQSVQKASPCLEIPGWLVSSESLNTHEIAIFESVFEIGWKWFPCIGRSVRHV